MRRLSHQTIAKGLVVLFITSFSVNGDHTAAQDSAALDRERATAERFLQVMMRRPRPGTALDRVYGFHVQNDSLDELIESLDVAADAEDAGKRTMILGLIQLQRGKPALSVEALARAEELLPDDAACSYYLGRAHLAIGQNEQAAAAMERAIERGPLRNEALPIFTELGRIYGRAGLNEKALAVWTKLEEMFPGDARVGQIARTLAEEGNVEEALKRYTSLAESSRKQEDKIAFAVQAAEMRRRLGQSEEATKDLEKILSRLRPGSWLYTDVRSRIEDGFLKSGDYDALAEYYKGQLAKSEDNLQLQIRLGRILVSAGRLDEAKQILEQAAERAPEDSDTRLALIDVLTNKGEIDAAAKQYETLSKQDPENPDYLLRWGQILLDDQDREVAARREAAAEVWQRLADARTDDAVTLSQIADRMRSIDRTDDAVALYRKAVEVDPESSQYREYLGEYLHQLDRKDEAIEAWKSIAEGDRRSRDTLVRLAEVFATFDMNDRALTAWGEAAEMDLNFGQELRYASSLREAKRFDDALTRLDAAETMAESLDEQEQLLKERIATYQSAGTLAEQIAELSEQEPNAANQRRLALMQQAAGQLNDAAQSIQAAIKAEPDNVGVLIVAADIAERQNRFGDAVVLFQKLASVDQRFRTNYLQRVTSLQMRLGQVEDALLTCEALIDANPASVESYQFFARTAFRAGRDDQAITALRRAMNVAPRDNGPRKMLASSFADRYRTDEAIELYWQAMRYESKTDDRIGLVRLLAPLYDRKAEIEILIDRIEEIGRQESDARATQLMIAAAHEAVQDYGEARQAIDQLVAQQPRDVVLLEAMVRLCDMADDLVLAAEFQQRVVALADTPDNRFKLVQLQLDADMIDVATALSERIALASDPTRLGSMIRSAVARGDHRTAIAICRESIRHDPSLWDVKLTMAQLLLFDVGENRDKSFEEAMSITQQLRNAKFPADAKPPTARKASTSRTTTRVTASRTGPNYWTQGNSTLARYHRLGRYSSYSFSSNPNSMLVQPYSFGHARAVAASLELVHLAKELSGDELTAAVDKYVQENFALPPAEEINDPTMIWADRAIKSMVGYLQPPPTGPGATAAKPSDEEAKRQDALNWRLAELDPAGGTLLLSTLMARVGKGGESDSGENADDAKVKPIEPLTDRQLDLLVELHDRSKNKPSTSNVITASSTSLRYSTVLVNELRIAGKNDEAEKYELQPPDEDASYAEVLSTMIFHLQLGDIERAEGLVDRLMPAIRNETGGQPRMARSSISGTIGQFNRTTNKAVPEFIEKHRLKLLDAFLADTMRQNTTTTRRNTGPSDGTIRAYSQMPNGGYRSIQVRGPLSTSLINQQMVSEATGLLPTRSDANPVAVSLELPDEFIEHLDKPLPDAPVYENKSRQTLAAFAHWWAKRPGDCYQKLVQLCEQYPDDVDLQIERARLANEMNQPRVALEALDSFDPLDSRMLVRKEMAAMNLAAQLGDVDRAKQSAERLFGMRMDTTTQLALVDQLRRLGMSDKASAVLQRLRGGRARSESVDLNIANAFLANDDKESAAEVAYTLLRRLGSGRATTSNVDSYRRQAVTILRTANRLDPLIQRAERRVQSAPSSMRARAELAELYTAAGRSKDADKLWDEVADKAYKDPRQMLARAESLSRARKYKEAGMMYLDAFEKQPSLFQRHVYQMTRAFQQSRQEDEMFKRLIKFPPNSLPTYQIDSILRLGRSSRWTENKRAFVRHALKSGYVQSNFSRIVNQIPADEIEKIPEIREVMINAACSSDAFLPQSNFWRISSYSGRGKVNGSLERTIGVVCTDEDVAARFQEAAKSALENEQQRPTAKVLLALVDLKKADDLEKATNNLRSLFEDDAQDTTTHTVSGGLLWQMGQMVETIPDIEDRSSLVVAIYEAAKRDPSLANSTSDFTYTIHSRLVQAYEQNDEFRKARRYLMDAYQRMDYSEIDQYNPGYGDYQQINTSRNIADGLVRMNYHFDALAIYRRILNEPAKFERAKRWGGSADRKRDFEKAARDAEKGINPSISAAYLAMIGDEIADAKGELAVDLLDLTIESMTQNDSRSGLHLAVDSASESEEGQEALRQLAAQLKELSESRKEDWSIPGAQVLVAAKVDPEQVPSLIESLRNRLPKQEDIAAVAGTPEADQFRVLLDLYTPAAAAIESDVEGSKESGRELLDYVKTIAKSIGEPSFELVLSRLTGDDSESLLQYLSVIEADRKAGDPLSASQAKTCLRIAKTAAATGDIALSTRAIELALGNGPPLREMPGATVDAFAIARTTNRNTPPVDNGMQELVAEVNQIVNHYSDALGEQLGAKKPKTNPESKVPADERDVALQQITDALASVIMPQDRPGLVFPYATNLVSRNAYDNLRSNAKLDPVSLACSVARSAALCQRSDELIDQIRVRMEKSSDKGEVASLMVAVALVAKDNDALNEGLDEFIRTLDANSSLPPASSGLGTRPTASVSITVQIQQDSYKKSETIDFVLRTIWPLLSESDFPGRDVTSRAHEVLSRTVALINSDPYTASRHRTVAAVMRKKLMEAADARNDQAAFDKYLDRDVAELKERYAGVPEEQREESFNRALESLMLRMLDDGFAERLPPFVRKVMIQADVGRRDYRSATAAYLCTQLAKLPKKTQYELLRRITLGEDDEEPILHLGSLVRYTTPPAMTLSKEQKERLETVQSLPTCDPRVPLTNTMWVVATLAADLGETEKLADALAIRSKTVGDDADVSAWLVRLAATDEPDDELLSALDGTLAAVANRLSETKPTKTDKKLKFPELEFMLLTRAIQLGLEPSQAQPLLQDVKAHAIRGEYNTMVSAISRLTANIGLGRAASGTTASPLEHFVPVPLPARRQPDVARLAPLYSVNDKGWLSGTGGYHVSLLMLRYPITGSFKFSATIRDGGWGEADVAYGGLLYQPAGFNKTAKVGTLLGTTNQFAVPAIDQGGENVEAVHVTPKETVGVCNEQPYVTDITAQSYPWVSISHHMFRTTQLRDIKIEGEPVIPREVNLVSPTMRGWDVVAYGSGLPDPKVPTGGKKDSSAGRSDGLPFPSNQVVRWMVKDGELNFPAASNGMYAPMSHIQYLRPLLDGESVEMSVWWKWGSFEVHPSVGRTVIEVTKENLVPHWLGVQSDLASGQVAYLATQQDDSKKPENAIANKNVPIDESWNLFKLTRQSDKVIVLLNDKPLTEIPVTEPPRPGLTRPMQREVRVRKIKLTGDWPTEVPKNLMQLAKD